ncbi:VanZ family protein [Schumannella soli]|uniref:VanZ family protein n=1 Tax=Schumannella soli TaxID=2590779 RepID=A0A506XYM8_9MICO|nr:VanZ family protein [Schumannella soli]TPW74832.1 VanZ family protein [Schumannella soli]
MRFSILHWGSIFFYPIWVGLAAMSVVIGSVLLRRGERGRLALVGMAGIVLVFVLGLTLLPTGQWTSGQFCSLRLTAPDLLSAEPFSNLGLFVPLGFFLALATRMPIISVAAGSLVSAGIEATQAYVTAIGRACDANDWMLNTAGTLVGVLLAVAVSVVARRSSARTSAAG